MGIRAQSQSFQVPIVWLLFYKLLNNILEPGTQVAFALAIAAQLTNKCELAENL
jgi:hypothetical protein